MSIFKNIAKLQIGHIHSGAAYQESLSDDNGEPHDEDTRDSRIARVYRRALFQPRVRQAFLPGTERCARERSVLTKNAFFIGTHSYYFENRNERKLIGAFPSPMPGVSPIQELRPMPSFSFTIKLNGIIFPAFGGSCRSSFQGMSAS